MMMGTMVAFPSLALSDPQRHPNYQPTPASGFHQAQLAAPGSVLHMAACPDVPAHEGKALLHPLRTTGPRDHRESQTKEAALC